MHTSSVCTEQLRAAGKASGQEIHNCMVLVLIGLLCFSGQEKEKRKREKGKKEKGKEEIVCFFPSLPPLERDVAFCVKGELKGREQ